MRATANAMKSARWLRRAQSLPEQLLWRLLRQARRHLRFRRQHAVGPYVADFYCPKAKLVIEVDGVGHDFTVDRDSWRDKYMSSLGLRVVRVAAADVLTNAEGVADGLLRLAEELAGPSTTQLG